MWGLILRSILPLVGPRHTLSCDRITLNTRSLAGHITKVRDLSDLEEAEGPKGLSTVECSK